MTVPENGTLFKTDPCFTASVCFELNQCSSLSTVINNDLKLQILNSLSSLKNGFKRKKKIFTSLYVESIKNKRLTLTKCNA